MAVGADTAAGLGAEGTAVQAGAGAQAQGPGMMSMLMDKLKSVDPEELKNLGALLKQSGGLMDVVKGSPKMQSTFQQMMQSMGGGGQGGGPTMGRVAPTEGPFMGDAASYSVDPRFAKAVLNRMGISGGAE